MVQTSKPLFLSGLGIFFMLLVIQKPAFGERFSNDGMNTTDDVFFDDSSSLASDDLLDLTDLKTDVTQDSLEDLSQNSSDTAPIFKVSTSTSTVSSKRELRTSQPPNTVEKASTVANSAENSKQDKALMEQMMTGTESKNDQSPSRLLVIQKLASGSNKKPVRNATEMHSLEDLLDVYSASRLSAVWNRTQDLKINQECHNDMTIFLRALRRGDLWALQSKYLNILTLNNFELSIRLLL